VAGLKSTAIRAPNDDPANHKIVLTQLKETTEIAQRLRGDPLDSFVRVRELVDAGMMRFTNGGLQPPSPGSLPPTVVPSTRKVKTAGSLTGGGDLSVDRTLQLVNDVGAPGNFFYYGTNGGGAKGFYAIPNQIFTRGAMWVNSTVGSPVSLPTNDVERLVPVACTLQEIIITGIGGPGSCQIDIWYVPFSGYPATVANSIIGTGIAPAISSGSKVSLTNFTGYTTTSFAADGFLVFHLVSSTTFTVVSIELRLQ
jgi:hypothetical protein